MKAHKKHADIKRPELGQFGRYELGLLGAPCDVIKKIVHKLCNALMDHCDITYIDADHHSAEPLIYTNLTDRISHDRIDFKSSLNDFDRKILLDQADVLLVNSNHFRAARQIVFCTEKKRDSLERKLDRLTDVGLVILDEGIDRPYQFLKPQLSSYDSIPVIDIHQIEEIVSWIKNDYKKSLPKIKGLVLAGGKSQRMGENKALLEYHGMPQVRFACQQMLDVGIQPTISCRREQSEMYNGDDFPLLHDTFEGLGPNGAILSAFRSDPDSAWLVTACDQPLLTSLHLKNLIDNRTPKKLATCYHNPETGFPEPLITLWEPKSYPRLLSFLSLGYSCPRKVLINSDVQEIHVDETAFMKNANTQKERSLIMSDINNS